MVVHVGLCVLPILYNFLIGHKLDITSFLCALPIGNINSRLRGHVHKTSAKFWGF